MEASRVDELALLVVHNLPQVGALAGSFLACF